MMELGRNEDERNALRLFSMGNALGRSIMAAPEVPSERVAALRKAFMDMMTDAEPLAFTSARNIDFGPPLPGEQVAKLVEDTLAASPEVVKMAKEARGF